MALGNEADGVKQKRAVRWFGAALFQSWIFIWSALPRVSDDPAGRCLPVDVLR